MKLRLLLLSGLLAIALGTLSCGGAGPIAASLGDTGTVEAAEPGETGPAPEFVLQDADGKEHKMSDYKGRVVLLNFWATWCGPCKIEMPWFIEFQRKYKDQGFSVVAVSLDEEGWDIVRPFLDDLKPNFPVLLGNDEMATDFGEIMALPTTLIIDKEGNITARHMGLISKDDYEAEIEELL